jgi:trk system potassium uptake protein TrkH
VNVRRTLHILGLVLLVLAAAQLLPIPWSLQAGDALEATTFLVCAGGTTLVGVAFRRFGDASGSLYRREGVLIVVGAWVLSSVAGAVPYLAAGAIASPVDALFESVSGFTTTGSSILADVEVAGRGVLFWRCLTQWLGGVGIVVLFVALLGELGPGARFLFRLEVPGPKTEILHARVQEAALTVLRIYLALSAAQVVFLLFCGLDVYDALTHTFSTVSTGGFSPYADSMGHFGTPARLVVLLFMIASGLNFSIYYTIWIHRDASALRDSELRLYGVLIAAATVFVTLDLAAHSEDGAIDPFVDVAFSVVSILTTTGFMTVDFDRWPEFAKGVLFVLIVSGGCAGSTAGGAKLVRVLIGWKATLREVRQTVSPKSVIAILIGDRPVPEPAVRSVLGFLVLWGFTWGAGTLLLSVGDVGLLTAAGAAATTLSNVGPGFDLVGPTRSFAFFADWQKLVMVALMWLGRLEFFALFAVLQPSFWRR